MSTTATSQTPQATTDSLEIRDSRTGTTYTVPIADGTIRTSDLRQIRVNDGDFGLMGYDPAFMNTASCSTTTSCCCRRFIARNASCACRLESKARTRRERGSGVVMRVTLLRLRVRAQLQPRRRHAESFAARSASGVCCALRGW